MCFTSFAYNAPGTCVAQEDNNYKDAYLRLIQLFYPFIFVRSHSDIWNEYISVEFCGSGMQSHWLRFAKKNARFMANVNCSLIKMPATKRDSFLEHFHFVGILWCACTRYWKWNSYVFIWFFKTTHFPPLGDLVGLLTRKKRWNECVICVASEHSTELNWTFVHLPQFTWSHTWTRGCQWNSSCTFCHSPLLWGIWKFRMCTASVFDSQFPLGPCITFYAYFYWCGIL